MINRFISAPPVGPMHLYPDPHLAQPLMIDPDNRLRLAWSPLSVAWRQQLGQFPAGWMVMRNLGPLPKIDDKVTCDGTTGVLLCKTEGEAGDQLLTHGDELWLGTGPFPAVPDLSSVEITTYPIPCLPPADGFHF